MKHFIGVDLGGTTIKTGIVDEEYNIVGRGTVKTDLPKSPAEICALIKESANIALKESSLSMGDMAWAGIGIPGIIDAEHGFVNFASNFDFHEVPIAAMAEKALGLPVFIENDANAAIYGEMINGSAKGCKNVVMLTLGTGVGGGVIIDGKIYSGFNSQGAELGHAGIFYGGEQCLCGNTGCIELYCSATALIRQTREAMPKDKTSFMWRLSGGSLDGVNGATCFEAMKLGDKTAAAVVAQYLDYLAYAVTNYINIFQPEIVVIGGGISSQGEILTEYLTSYAKRHALGFANGNHTRIETVSLGNDAGIIGAAFLGAAPA